jgi:transcriptional regulator with XRE-family HTH domain
MVTKGTVEYRFEFDGEELKRRRQEAGLSYTQAGYLTGRSAQAVHCWESGRFPPGTTVFLKLCQILRCRPQDLLRRVEDGDEHSTEMKRAG